MPGFRPTASQCPSCGAPLEPGAAQCRFCDAWVPGAEPPPGWVPDSIPAPIDPAGAFSMPVDDVFSIKKRGTVVTGRIASGSIRVGDTVVVHGAGGSVTARCRAVEMFRKQLDEAHAGDNVGLLLDGVDKGDVARGDWVRAG